MQIILRMTTRCNFKCTMCSASDLSRGTDLSIENIIAILQKYNKQPNNICFEGGDPLCVKPQLYYDLFERIDNDPSITINEYNFTTNLWDFYKHPNKWVDIFKRPDVRVCTSFQYGNQRMITNNKVFDEKTFIEIFEKFENKVDKKVPFITVIDEDNCHSVIQTVKLAQRLDTMCKINPLFMAGRSKSFYRWDHMLKHYCDIFEAGLEQYESNCVDIIRMILGKPMDINCPWVRNCGDKFVVATPDGWLSSCSIENSTLYNNFYPIKFYDRNNLSNITLDKSRTLVSSNCLTCDHFNWCNSCRIKIGETKSLFNIPGEQDNFCNTINTCVKRLTNFVKHRYENNPNSPI